ncbi:hypothetical protein LCGC14_1581750, partial [marine sediment metagenome]
MKLFIYLLIDPQDKKPMYIGMSKDPGERLKMHMYPSQLKLYPSHPKTIWLNELLFLALKPVLQVLEEVDETNANNREVYWINHYKNINPNLTNTDLVNINNRAYGD